MYSFERYILIKENDGYVIKLYLDKQLCEISLEFWNLLRRKETNIEKENLEYAAKEYIKSQFPGLKVKLAYIVLGSMIIASIPFIDSVYAEANDPAVPTVIDENSQDILDNVNENNDTDTTYTVKTGDTLWRIADHFNLSVDQIKSFNSLQSDSIYVGQILIISVQAPDIKKDDSTNTSKDENNLLLVNKKNPLSSDYVPENLMVPDVPFTFSEYSEAKLMSQDAALALGELFESAKSEGINLYALSGYRSYDRQAAIFAASVKKNGSEYKANQFSAKAGQSEHQTGLAIDVTSASVNYTLAEDFGETKEGKWLSENAYKFGFIIRYQKGKESITGYNYEPWHLRYVGKTAADQIKSQNTTLEEYLGKAL